MADRTMLAFEVDDELGKYVAETVDDGSRYESAGDFLRDLIRQHRQYTEASFEAVKAELQRAFATPIEDYVMVSAEDVIARGRARRRQG